MAALAGAVTALGAEGLEAEDLAIRRPTLDEVFVLTAVGLAVGWRAPNGVGPALAAFGLLLLLRAALLWVGVYLGLLARGPGAQHNVAAAAVWPLLILAVFVPLSVHRFREMNR